MPHSSPSSAHLGTRVQQLRESRGMTAYGLARLLHVPPTSLEALEECGDASLDTLRAARAFLRNPEAPRLRLVRAEPRTTVRRVYRDATDEELAIGDACRAIRARLGVSQRELAKLMGNGLTQGQVAAVESARTHLGSLIYKRVRYWIDGPHVVKQSAWGVE